MLDGLDALGANLALGSGVATVAEPAALSGGATFPLATIDDVDDVGDVSRTSGSLE